MNKAYVNGVQLNYEIRGNGPNLLFINGIGADLKTPIGLFNSPIVEHFRVLAFDPRGLGESEGTEPYSMGDLAEDAQALAAAVGWEHYHVFGASMGGMVAQELAIRYPDAVEKLVLAVTNSGGDNGVPVLVDKMFDLPVSEALKVSDTRQDEQWAAAHPEVVEGFAAKTKMMKDAMEANPAFKKGFDNQVRAVLKHDTTDRLPKIKAATLIFNGRFDGSIPITAAELMAKQIQNATFEIVDHGHGSWFFDPNVWEMVVKFLK